MININQQNHIGFKPPIFILQILFIININYELSDINATANFANDTNEI